jgi:hypothetical protein
MHNQIFLETILGGGGVTVPTASPGYTTAARKTSCSYSGLLHHMYPYFDTLKWHASCL